MKRNILLILLLLAFLADLFFIYQGNHESRFFTKPLLIPLLAGFYVVRAHEQKRKINRLFFSGLFLSFLGDVFLLFPEGFLPGLISFLLAHVCYIFCFKKLKIKNLPIFIPPVLVYLFTLLYILFPYLNGMKIPVVIYGITISTMLYFSICTKNKLLILGALLFIISDSVLSYSMFVEGKTEWNLLVMISYITAQLFLVLGILKSSESYSRHSN